MSDDWEDELAALRASFLQDAWQRVDSIEALIEQLAMTPDPALWQQPQTRAEGEGGGSSQTRLQRVREQLLRRFHAFAGSGTTYGFPLLTELGQRGEQACRARIGQLGGETAELEELHALAAAVRSALQSSAPPPPPRDAPDASPHVPRESRLLLAMAPHTLPPAARALLTADGRTLTQADSFAEACALVQQRLPDALITQGELPGGSGFDLVRLLRDQVGGDVPPALLLGPAAAFLDRVEAIHCGADGVFEDPVDWEPVAQRLTYLLERDASQPARVLAVEDDPYQAAFVRSVLESAGYEVHTCDHPRTFEVELDRFRPDLVLMDVLLPDASGFDVVRWLRQYERFAALPVLFLTTAGEMHERIAGVQAGGDDHLIKPVPPALLLSSVAARLERARLLRSLLERDGLTHLLTHTEFMQRAHSLHSRHSHPGGGDAVWVQLDIDAFKAVNDRHGHPVGDRVLVALAGLLHRRLRQSDVIGRYGGDEFAVLIEGLGLEAAVRLLDRVREEFGQIAHPAPGAPPFRASFSAGVALLGSGSPFEGWRKAAHDGLDQAKQAGRNRILAAR